VLIIMLFVLAARLGSLLTQQGFAISDGDLVIVRMNFAESEKPVPVSTIFNEGRL